MMNESLKIELKRKCFHFFSFFYALGYLVLGRGKIIMILTPLLILEGSVEFGRFFSPRLNERLLAFFGGIHREEESKKASGIFWTLAGSLLTIILFHQREIVLCSMAYLIFGDAAAALIGTVYGRHKIGKKSLEGSLACFVICFSAGLLFFPLMISFIGALFATLIELFPLPFNDNFWMPVLSGFFLTFITR